eukprot:COSAG05_NODE_13018_length_444_cov_3.197101_1_plen_115_part_10
MLAGWPADLNSGLAAPYLHVPVLRVDRHLACTARSRLMRAHAAGGSRSERARSRGGNRANTRPNFSTFLKEDSRGIAGCLLQSVDSHALANLLLPFFFSVVFSSQPADLIDQSDL